MADYVIINSLENRVGRTDRYQYARIRRENQTFFMKKALVADEEENLTRELVWADFVEKNDTLFAPLAVRAPHHVELLDDSTYVCEWLDGCLLADPNDAKKWVKQLKKYAALLATIDEASSYYTVPESLCAYKRRQPLDQIGWWLREVPLSSVAQTAQALVHQHIMKADFRMQHGDLTPWQIMVVGDEWVVFDGERSGDDLPRFNDIAYSFGRLALRCNDEQAAWRLLDIFVKLRSLNSHEQKRLYIVILFRLLGMLGDCVRRDKNKDEQARVEKILDTVTGMFNLSL